MSTPTRQQIRALLDESPSSPNYLVSTPQSNQPHTPDVSPIISPLSPDEVPETPDSSMVVHYEPLDVIYEKLPYISCEHLVVSPKSLAETFECVMCYGIARDPKTLGSCDHLHCYSCLVKARLAKRMYREPKDDLWECGKCRTQSKEVFTSYMVKQMLSEIKVSYFYLKHSYSNIFFYLV